MPWTDLPWLHQIFLKCLLPPLTFQGTFTGRDFFLATALNHSNTFWKIISLSNLLPRDWASRLLARQLSIQSSQPHESASLCQSYKGPHLVPSCLCTFHQYCWNFSTKFQRLRTDCPWGSTFAHFPVSNQPKQVSFSTQLFQLVAEACASASRNKHLPTPRFNDRGGPPVP